MDNEIRVVPNLPLSDMAIEHEEQEVYGEIKSCNKRLRALRDENKTISLNDIAINVYKFKLHLTEVRSSIDNTSMNDFRIWL